ncbi:Protein CBG15980 [Caenorhabditis briggsae]|nr:Protein CBG15980 [Caenorhabditis briggsae]CAP34361.1 Protein CBG15980 [Caenorhabditis briggsae]
MWNCAVVECAVNHIPTYSPHYGISRGCSPSSSSGSCYSVAASPPAHNGNNIDNKIEQAMDLVKTHLMFAVREEVDGLRSKIFDLENHVRRLEAENSILKRTIPNDTLNKLHLKL